MIKCKVKYNNQSCFLTLLLYPRSVDLKKYIGLDREYMTWMSLKEKKKKKKKSPSTIHIYDLYGTVKNCVNKVIKKNGCL